MNNSLDINSSCFVFASAGSGKTRLLVNRYIKALYYGLKPSEILCLTFTNVAVNEMAQRISDILLKLHIETDEFIKSYLKDTLEIDYVTNKNIKWARQLFNIFQEELPNSKILTIHSFCQLILQEFPIEANISAEFEIIEQNDLLNFLEQAKENVFSKNPQLVKQIIDNLSVNYINDLIDDINFEKCINFFNKNRSLKKYEQLLYKIFNIKPTIKFNCDQESVINKYCNKNKLEDIFLTKTGTIRKKFLLQNIDQCDSTILSIAQIIFENRQTKNKEQTVSKTILILRIIKEIFNELQILKGDLLDFTDILYKTSELLTNYSDYILPIVCKDIKTILLDEAQDLSGIQWKIVGLIAEEMLTNIFFNKTIFIVGDIKQSIYRFQGANCQLFLKFFNYIKLILNKIKKPCLVDHLDKCYRTLPVILQNIDKVFETCADFAFGTKYRKHIAVRKGNGIFKLVETNEPYEIASYVKNNNISDALVLFRSRNKFSLKLYNEFLKLNLKTTPMDKAYLQDSLIIQDIISLANIAIDNNRDYDIVCVLNSPYIFNQTLSNSEMFDLCYKRQVSVLEGLKNKFPDKYKVLENVIKIYKENNLVEFFYYIVSGIIKNYSNNDEELISSFINLVLNYSEKYDDNIKNFIEYFKKYKVQLYYNNINDSGLRFMSIHSSKGLEAKTILLMNFKLTADKIKTKFIWSGSENIFESNPLFFIKPSISFREADTLIKTEYENEEKELLRLLYVALTRPRDNIYIFGTPEEGTVFNLLKNTIRLAN